MHESGEPPQVSPGSEHAVPGVQVPPQPSLGASPHGRVEGGEQVGAQQLPLRQRSPAGHIVPFGHIGQPAGSVGSTPHAMEAAEPHVGQQAPPVHEPVPAGQRVPVPQPPVRHAGAGTVAPHATLPADGQLAQHIGGVPVQVPPVQPPVPVPGQSRHSTPPTITSGMSMPHGMDEADGHEPQQTRVPPPVVPGGFTHAVPAAHIVPKLHAPGAPRHGGVGTVMPQGVPLAAGQFAQHIGGVPVQVPPVHPPVPVPGQSRHSVPPGPMTSGMSVPHGTDEAAGHAPQHTRAVGALVPGGFTQVVGAVQSEPTPVHARHGLPSSSMAPGMVIPHGIEPGASQPGQHAPPRHSSVPSQRVPSPVHGIEPEHVSGTSSPQSTMPGATQVVVQVQTPATHARSRSQGPLQRPPQPSESPHMASVAQLGMHSQRPVSGLHSSCAPGHGPTQNPPQPSGSPQAASAAQRGMHTQLPAMQRAGASHAGSQSHVSMHVPFWQTSPRAHVTPKHGFGRHVPARQNSPSAHVMPSHAERGVQVK